jgi:uncharacterized Zn finger protein
VSCAVVLGRRGIEVACAAAVDGRVPRPKAARVPRRWSSFPAYVSVADRRARAAQAAARLGGKLGKGGTVLAPVVVATRGRQTAATFWGKAWCRNLELYSDYASRLPRGRSYLRSGAVIDLQVAAGEVRAQVMGSHLYQVSVTIKALPDPHWQAVVGECAGRIDSLVTLLEGRMPEQVLQLITDPQRGLFPEPRQISMRCSCPDGAVMCKHVAAALYGVGVRLDERPELLFVLRKIDPAALVHAATGALAAPAPEGALVGQDLEALFGISLAAEPLPVDVEVKKVKKPRSRRTRPSHNR